MKVGYKRDFHHSYLILEEEGTPDYEAYPVRMLLNGSVPGLLSCQIHRVDNRARFYYEITSRQPFCDLCEIRKLNKDNLALLIGALIRTMEELEGYLLDPSHLLLSPEYIYVNEAEREVSFCFWPGELEEEQSFLRLAEYLLPKIDHQDQEAVVLGYQLYRRVMEGNVDPGEIRKELYREAQASQICQEEEEGLQKEEETAGGLTSEFLEEESRRRKEVLETLLQEGKGKKKKVASWKITACVTAVALAGILYFYLIRNRLFFWPLYAGVGTGLIFLITVVLLSGKIFERFSKRIPKKEKREKDEENEEDKEEKERRFVFYAKPKEEIPDISEDAPTTLLSRPPQTEDFGKLQGIYPPGTVDIPLKEGTMILGKREGAVDILLSSPAVSRVHAKIQCGKTCRVFDLNSRNGTYVNYTQAVDYEGRTLQEGDTVTFADMVFRYVPPCAFPRDGL